MQRRSWLSAALGCGVASGAVGVPAWPLSTTELGYVVGGGLRHQGSALAFGTTVSITLLHHDARTAQAAIAAALSEVQKIDALMSLYQTRSQVFALNRDGFVDRPDPHLRFVLNFAQQLSGLTAGAFDVTVQPLWQTFNRARAKSSLPGATEIAQARARVNWRHLDVQTNQVRFTEAGMGLTLNGLAQGYAVDLAVQALRTHGVQQALLDTGEHAALGSKAPSQPWVLGIAHPRQPGELVSRVKMDTRMVATSGDYASAFSSDLAHHHIFDPHTGDSPPTLASVTVVAPSGILADGLATAFMVTGAQRALALCAQWPDVDVLLIDKSGATRQSANFPALRLSACDAAPS